MARSAGFRRAVPGIAVAVLSLALLACGGGSTASGPAAPSASNAIRLSLHAESLKDSTVRVLIQANDAAELYQLSCRLIYDPVAVRALAATPGSLVDQRAVFFTSDWPDGYVPVAFTYHPGETIPAASGTIATCEFELLGSSEQPAFDLLRDPEYLLAADARGAALPVSVEAAQ